MIASLSALLKIVALIAIELNQYDCNLLGYGLALIKLEGFPCLPWAPISVQFSP